MTIYYHRLDYKDGTVKGVCCQRSADMPYVRRGIDRWLKQNGATAKVGDSFEVTVPISGGQDVAMRLTVKGSTGDKTVLGMAFV